MKHCLIKVKEEFMIKLARIKTILMVFHSKTCLKIIMLTMGLVVLVEVETKIWVDSNPSFKIFLVMLLLNKDQNPEKNLKIKEKT